MMECSIYILLFATIVSVDQLSKKYVRRLFSLNSRKRINNWLYIRLVTNTGGFYSILKGKRKLITITATVMSFFVLFVLVEGYYDQAPPIFIISLIFILGGAVGNLIDRFSLGYVVDFIEIDIKRFPIFNIADVFIITGGLLIIYIEIFGIYSSALLI